MTRSILCRYRPATSHLGRRIHCSDHNFSNTYGMGLLENKYGLGDNDRDEYHYMTRAAATEFLRDRYPDWLNDTWMVHSIIKIRGTEIDVWTAMHRGKTLYQPLVIREDD